MSTDSVVPSCSTVNPAGARRARVHAVQPGITAELDPTLVALGPMIDLPDVETRIAGALDGLDRGLTLLPVDPATKAPIGLAQPYLDGRRNLTPAEVERHARRGAFFAVCNEPSGVITGDLDATDPAAAGPWAEHFTGPHVALTRRMGRHAFYVRPDGTPARRVIRAEGRPVDILGKGYTILWTGHMPEPVELPPDLAAVLDPPKPRAPGLTGLPVVPVLPVASDRGEAYALAAIASAAADVAALPEGQRQDGLTRTGFNLGRALKRASAGHLAGQAEDAIVSGAPWADTRKERDTIRRAIAAGMAAEREGLADRTPGAVDPSGQDLEPNAAAEVERTRAAAAARLDQLDQALDAIALEFFTIHCVSSTGREFTRPNTQRRETTRLAATRILERAENMGRSTFTYGAAELARRIGRGRASLIAAGPALAALGLTSTPGRIGAEGLPLGRRWSVAGLDPESSARADTCPGAAAGGAGDEGVNVKCLPLPMIIQHSETDGPGDAGDVHISRANEAAGELCRGARARRGDPAPTVERLVVDEETGLVEEKIVAIGPTGHLVLEALRRLSAEGAEADVETVAETAGLSLRTAGETLRRLGVQGVASSSTAPTGKAGGQRKLWALVETTAPAVQAVIARGKWVIQRAAARVRAAWESFTHTLRKRIEETGRAAAAVGANLAAELKERTQSERDPINRRYVRRKLGEAGRLVMEGRPFIQEPTETRKAATSSTPPPWAVDFRPLEVLAAAWAGWTEAPPDDRPDSVIAFALQLGAVARLVPA